MPSARGGRARRAPRPWRTPAHVSATSLPWKVPLTPREVKPETPLTPGTCAAHMSGDDGGGSWTMDSHACAARRRDRSLALAPMVALTLAVSGCAGWGGGAGGGGPNSINVLMVNNPQMVDLQQ